MKKTLTFLILTLLSMNVSAEEALCANGNGYLLTAVNGNKYCLHKNDNMNWWSAFAWCDTAGGTLISINKDCDCTGFAECNTTVQCPNLYNIGKNNSVWSATTYNSNTAYTVHLGSGNVTQNNSVRTYAYHKPLCRLNP